MSEFSEAARLYAENESLVEAMHAAFQQDVLRFLDGAVDAARGAVPGLEVSTNDTRGHRYIWVSVQGAPQTALPQLWCKYDDGSIVRRQSITFTFMYPNSSNVVVVRMREAVAAALAPLDLMVQGKKAIEFSFAVPFGGTPPPASVVGEALAVALTAMESVRNSQDSV